MLTDAVLKHLTLELVADLASRLVSVPSHTVAGQEQAANILEQFLHNAGIATKRQIVENWGVNIIATLPSETGEIGLALNGHLDTVPPSVNAPFSPFEAIIHDGCLWGRGAADMKGGLASMAAALKAIHAAGIPLKRSVALTAVAAEEQGNRGTAALLNQGFRATWAVVGEPTGMDVVIAHKGVDRYRVIVKGRATHESMPEQGINAIIAAAYMIVALDRELFSHSGKDAHPLLGTPTYNVGIIQGGISRNIVPDQCIFQISKRWLPGDSPQAIRQEIEAVIRSVRTQASVSVMHEPEYDIIPHSPLDISPTHPLVRSLVMAMTQVTGCKPTIKGMPAFTDGALLQAAGIPAVVFGPGDLSLAHSDNEHVPLADLLTAAQIYAALAISICA